MGSALPLVLPEFHSLLFAVRRCAIASRSRPAANLQITDDERLGELHKQGFRLLRSSGDGSNCLVHSLALVLAAAGLIQDMGDWSTACADARQHFAGAPGLQPMSPAGVPNPGAYLEHGRHGPPAVQMLVEAHGLPGPAAAVKVTVHARYDTAGSPPDSFEAPIAAAAPGRGGATAFLHLWNWTGDGTSGYHYDGLVPPHRGRAF